MFEADAAIDAAAGQMELLAEPHPLVLRVHLQQRKRRGIVIYMHICVFLYMCVCDTKRKKCANETIKKKRSRAFQGGSFQYRRGFGGIKRWRLRLFNVGLW